MKRMNEGQRGNPKGDSVTNEVHGNFHSQCMQKQVLYLKTGIQLFLFGDRDQRPVTNDHITGLRRGRSSFTQGEKRRLLILNNSFVS